MGRTGRDSHHAAGSKTKYHQEWVHEHPSRTLFLDSPSIFSEDVQPKPRQQCSSASMLCRFHNGPNLTPPTYLVIFWGHQFCQKSSLFKLFTASNVVSQPRRFGPVQLTQWKIPVPASTMDDRGLKWVEVSQEALKSTGCRLQPANLWRKFAVTEKSQLLSKVYAEAETSHATSTLSHSEDRVLLPGRWPIFQSSRLTG